MRLWTAGGAARSERLNSRRSAASASPGRKFVDMRFLGALALISLHTSIVDALRWFVFEKCVNDNRVAPPENINAGVERLERQMMPQTDTVRYSLARHAWLQETGSTINETFSKTIVNIKKCDLEIDSACLVDLMGKLEYAIMQVLKKKSNELPDIHQLKGIAERHSASQTFLHMALAISTAQIRSFQDNIQTCVDVEMF